MKIDDLTEQDVGRKVVYVPFKDCDFDLYEEGVITSWNDVNVFVRYGSDCHSKATSPCDINFIGA